MDHRILEPEGIASLCSGYVVQCMDQGTDRSPGEWHDFPQDTQQVSGGVVTGVQVIRLPDEHPLLHLCFSPFPSPGHHSHTTYWDQCLHWTLLQLLCIQTSQHLLKVEKDNHLEVAAC